MELKDYPILYVDDEHANRVVMKHNLGQPFALLIADSADAALEILAREPVAVLLADQRMPRVTGVDLAERVLQRYPDVVRVIITAYSDLEATIDAINRARVNRFIKKPWTREELVAVMNESILAYHNGQLVKRLQQRLMELDRMTALAVMAGAIGHDLRQPLGYIVSNVEVMELEFKELLSSRTLDPDARERLENLQDALGDLRHGVDKFRLIADTLLNSLRDRTPRTASIDVVSAVESALAITRGTVARGAQLQAELPDGPVMMEASEGRVIQLVVNLVLNAVQAINGPKWRNTVGVSVSETEDRVTLRVRDTGCGIPRSRLEQIFVPLFTTKGASGSGLGLAICQEIVKEMRGTIAAESTEGEGSVFTVVAPRRRDVEPG